MEKMADLCKNFNSACWWSCVLSGCLTLFSLRVSPSCLCPLHWPTGTRQEWPWLWYRTKILLQTSTYFRQSSSARMSDKPKSSAPDDHRRKWDGVEYEKNAQARQDLEDALENARNNKKVSLLRWQCTDTNKYVLMLMKSKGKKNKN